MNLVDHFKKVGLKLRILTKPIQLGRGMVDIFQMDIGRKVKGTRREEWFEIYTGHEDNRIEVLNVDKKSMQLVLFVHEPPREFEVSHPIPPSWKNNIHENLKKIAAKRDVIKIRKIRDTYLITHVTPSDKRHFLLGLDERQLFVAQLSKAVTTVDAARKSLGSTIQFHEGKRKMTPRQGEWFFIKTTAEQEELIENMLSLNQTFIQKKKSIGDVHRGRQGGNPHVADEIVVIPESEVSGAGVTRRDGKSVIGNFPVRMRQVFVRGKIRHIDHKTIKYKHWYEVVLNNEGGTSNGSSSGISWID